MWISNIRYVCGIEIVLTLCIIKKKKRDTLNIPNRGDI